MSSAYRDENESLRARNTQLETQLAERQRTVEALEKKLGDHDAVFEQLRGVMTQGAERSPRAARRFSRVFLGGIAMTVLGIGAAMIGVATRSVPVAAAAEAAPTQAGQTGQTGTDTPRIPNSLPRSNPMQAPAPIGADLCSRLGVRLTVGGSDAEAVATGERDQAGHKYRRGGDRSPWFTVNGFSGRATEKEEGGSLYVTANGGYLPGDIGTTNLTLFDIMTKGETGGYTLARDGKSVLEITGADGKRVWGRFEADMSRVDDVTRTPPFGTPVVRVRGNFCLPAHADDPNDTGP